MRPQPEIWATILLRLPPSVSWDEFLELRTVDKTFRNAIDMLAGASSTRNRLKVWLKHVRRIEALSARDVVRVARSLGAHATSDMLWRVIGEIRGLKLEPGDDFISVLALLGVSEGVAQDARYLAAMKKLVEAAGTPLPEFDQQYRIRASQVRSRFKPGFVGWTPGTPVTGAGAKVVQDIENWKSPILVSDCTEAAMDPRLMSGGHDILSCLKSSKKDGLRYGNFRTRVLGWLSSLASGFYGEQLLVELDRVLRKKNRQVLIRPRPSILDQEKHNHYSLFNISGYNPGVAVATASNDEASCECFVWHEPRMNFMKTAKDIREGKRSVPWSSCLGAKPGHGTHVLLELEPNLDDSTKLPTETVLAQFRKAMPSKKGTAFSVGCTLTLTSPNQPASYHAETPAFIVIGHELIHALHDAQGIGTGLYAPKDALFDNYEEERTIRGDGDSPAPWDPCPLTENLLRSDHGFPGRISHRGSSRFLDEQGRLAERLLQKQKERDARISAVYVKFKEIQRRDNITDDDMAEVDKLLESLQARDEFLEFLSNVDLEEADFDNVPDKLR